MTKIKSELEPNAKLAFELVQKPHLHDVFEATHPKAFKDIIGLLNSPFYRWQPFGERVGSGSAQFCF